ncbi:MAG TPA: tetratricopeptide repeat protein [Patescibacteria group bacterium]|nr:tetratricopeptide repeat protein [Patescibacteria group bacterium]
MRLDIFPVLFAVIILSFPICAAAGEAEYTGAGGGGAPVATQTGPDIEALKAQAAAGKVRAMYLLGKAYDDGDGVTQDYVEAAKWYEMATDKNDLVAPGKLAVLLAKGQGVQQDYVRARTLFLISAQNGDRDSQMYLAFLLAGGIGGKKDYDGAATWFKRAAGAGSPVAQYNLAVLYDKGLGVPRNEESAMKWYRKAAEDGNSDAAFALGEAYFNGRGVGRDLIEAYAWLSFADAMGNSEAATVRASISGALTTKDLTKAQMQFKTYLDAYGRQSESAEQ